MKRLLLGMVILGLVGCAYEGTRFKDYFEDPKLLIEDPLFLQYRQEREDLEKQYLNKKISYAEYLQELRDLDARYDKEVEDRMKTMGE